MKSLFKTLQNFLTNEFVKILLVGIMVMAWDVTITKIFDGAQMKVLLNGYEINDVFFLQSNYLLL